MLYKSDSHQQSLAELEPLASDIASFAERFGPDIPRSVTPLARAADVDKYRYYVSRVGGSEYVVSVSRQPMTRRAVEFVLANAMDETWFATQREPARDWLDEVSRMNFFQQAFHRLYSGYVHIRPRDAFDIVEPALDRGLVGYTLQSGDKAILQANDSLPDDPDFFTEVLHQVKPDGRIELDSHLTPSEKRRYSDVYSPLLRRLQQLIWRDGQIPQDAYERYEHFFRLSSDRSAKIMAILEFSTHKQAALQRRLKYVVYRPKPGHHLLIEQTSYPRGPIYKIYEETEAEDGTVEKREYEQSLSKPYILMADIPRKYDHQTGFSGHRERLFALSDADALDLNSLLQELVEAGCPL